MFLRLGAWRLRCPNHTQWVRGGGLLIPELYILAHLGVGAWTSALEEGFEERIVLGYPSPCLIRQLYKLLSTEATGVATGPRYLSDGWEQAAELAQGSLTVSILRDRS